MTQKLNVLIDSNIPLLSECIRLDANVANFSGRTLNKKILKENSADYLFVRSTTKVDASLLDDTLVRFVGTATSGIDHIDKDYLNEKKILFFSAPGSNANSVAEYVVYTILKWAFQRNVNLEKETLGIIGFGNIGRLVAEYANYIGLKVLVNDPPLKSNGFRFPEFAEYCELSEICSNSTVITNHVPLTDTGAYPTKHLLNEEHIGKLKEGTLFIHTSRGGIVDEKSLLKYLQRKQIKLAIDVWENEPLINIELAKAALLATPHIAGYSYDGKIRGTMAMAEAFIKHSGLKCNLEVLYQEESNYVPAEKMVFKNTHYLYIALKNTRRLDEDTAKFLRIATLPENQRKRFFDGLRKKYPKRSEML